MFFRRWNGRHKHVDEVDIPFYDEFRELSVDEQRAIRDFVHLKLVRRKRKEAAQFILALLGMISLLIVISTFIQSFYAFSDHGQRIYASGFSKDLSSFLLIPGVHFLIATALRYFMPCVKTRWRLLVSLLVLASIMVFVLPAVLLLTIGEVACWDVAIVVIVSALITVSWSDVIIVGKPTETAAYRV